jgi:hypothetical protein
LGSLVACDEVNIIGILNAHAAFIKWIVPDTLSINVWSKFSSHLDNPDIPAKWII